MYLFWESIIRPTLRTLNPQSIVEIGCDAGKHTRKLLSYCKDADCVLHAIDPEPQFDVQKLLSEYEGTLSFYRDLSLNALVKIEKMDAVLIDGDHNWYSVYNELKLIERQCPAGFPLTFVHDIGWPYGRRDSYWAPDTIPEEYRHPFETKGMLPGKNTLVEQMGFNTHLNNACIEQVDRNGVLTAIEDFNKQTELDLKFVKLPGMFGLGILFPSSLPAGNSEFSNFVKQLDLPEHIYQYAETLESERIYLVLSSDANKKKLDSCTKEHKQESATMKEKNDALSTQLNSSASQIQALKTEAKEKTNRLQAHHQKELADKDKEFESLTVELQEQAKKKQEKFQRHNQESIRERNSKIASLQKSAKHQQNESQVKYQQLSKRHQRVIQSEAWKLIKRVRKIESSRAGKFLVKLLRNTIKELRYQKHAVLIRRSDLFDKQFYLMENPDVARSKMNPLRHFVVTGWREGRNPSKHFDTKYYLEAHRDVAALQTNPLVHYLTVGRAHGRSTQRPDGATTQQRQAKPHRAAPNDADIALLGRIHRHKEYKKIRGKARVVIYTAVTGNYDVLKQHQYICDDWDYVCITDRPIPGIYNWEFLHTDYMNSDPVRTARYYKTHPHIAFPDHEYSIWIDANIDILGNHLEKVVERLIRQNKKIASVPHPHWDCVYTEAEKCIELEKDDPEAIQKQVAFLKEQKFPPQHGLIETNVMFRKHNDEKIIDVMKTWWSVIARFSRRDQLSFNYSLSAHQLDCDHIFKETSQSTRNHPHYRYHLHQSKHGNGYEPYRIPYFNQELPRLPEQIFRYDHQRPFNCNLKHLDQLTMSIIVPVHNALTDVKRCLDSLEKSRSMDFQIVVADDASDKKTKSWIRSFIKEKNHFTLIENRKNLGYTRNINKAIKHSQADFIILLNSDTIVSPGWVEKMILCAYSSDDIGLVGPLSNAASWQSLPDIEDEIGNIAINSLPRGMTVESVNHFLEERSLHPLYPKVHLLNGFCLGIKRKVFDAIGLFDQDSFPRGYGEEDDFCLKAGEAGFSLAVATHTYVFHAKSKSFGSAQRAEITSRSWEIMESRYGIRYLKNAIESAKRHPGLANIRSLFQGDKPQELKPRNDLPQIDRGWSSIEVPNLRSSYDSPQTTKSYEAPEPYQGSNDVKLMAYYLPQFYPFKKNDEVWGKGFTEWTNVTRSLPLFKGHNQPKLPDALGFYDTRLKETLLGQVELAKKHGIFGFCFHHYFFNDQPVMRAPFNLFLDNCDIDFPFCLHWANEPWTTTWSYTYMDKSKDQVIYDQEHSEANDMAFIKDIHQPLLDPRYIRVKGCPLLLVYRPGLFPDIKATIERWRQYCLKNGIGDLHMVMVHTNAEGEQDPRKLGFDAAVEFPPHLIKPSYIHNHMDFFIPDFDGTVIDYRSVMISALEKPRPKYTKYRGLFPRWDNTPRKIQGTSIFVNDSPDAYQQWLEGLIRYSRKNLPEDERFIFINAWNEWAEGAFLEPDRKYGYAYLNACGRALEKTSLGKEQFRLNPDDKIGIQIHVFHLDTFGKLFKAINDNFHYPADLLISTTDEQRRSHVAQLTSEYKNGKVIIRVFQNQGRDIAPFIVGFRDLIPSYTYMLHLHTKKSDYDTELSGWLDYLVEQLLGSRKTVSRILSRLSKSDVGVVFPPHFYKIQDKIHWGANLKSTNGILKYTGIHLFEDDIPFFPSGSMFYFKPDALSGLFSKRFCFEDFSPEANQLDGTLAHAIERSFCYFAQSAGYKSVML